MCVVVYYLCKVLKYVKQYYELFMNSYIHGLRICKEMINTKFKRTIAFEREKKEWLWEGILGSLPLLSINVIFIFLKHLKQTQQAC